MNRCAALAAVAALLLSSCNGDSERIKELENKIERMESQQVSLLHGPDANPSPAASVSPASSFTSATGPAASPAGADDPAGNICNDGKDRYLTLVNRSGQTIMYFFASPPSAGDWEEDVLGEEVVVQGERFRINFNTDERCTCTYDTRAVFADDSEVIRKVNVCNDHTQTYP